MGKKYIKIILLLTISFFTIALFPDDCLNKAIKIIKKYYPPGHVIISYTGLSSIFSPLVRCTNNRELYYSLPNFMHEIVHYAGFKIMGIQLKHVKVEVKDIAKIYSGRTVDELHDEGFFISKNKQIVIRGIKLPPRKFIRKYIPAQFFKNPNFKIYLTGQEAEGGYLTLLDELNAYTHELRIVTALYPKTIPPGKKTIQKDNIAAIQFMILIYLNHTRRNTPEIYQLMKRNDKIRNLTELFYKNAEKSLLSVKDEKKYKKIRFTWPFIHKAVRRNRFEFLKFVND